MVYKQPLTITLAHPLSKWVGDEAAVEEARKAMAEAYGRLNRYSDVLSTTTDIDDLPRPGDFLVEASLMGTDIKVSMAQRSSDGDPMVVVYARYAPRRHLTYGHTWDGTPLALFELPEPDPNVADEVTTFFVIDTSKSGSHRFSCVGIHLDNDEWDKYPPGASEAPAAYPGLIEDVVGWAAQATR